MSRKVFFPSGKAIWNRVWRISPNIWIFKYFWSKYLFRYLFVSFFGYEYIWIFVCVIFLDTNIFGYSFVARFWYKYIGIFVHINFQILTRILFNFYGYYTLLMDIWLISMIKNAIWIVKVQNWCQSSPECDKYIWIFEYFWSKYSFGYSFVSKF